jgi:hypothetical protein
MLGYRRRGAMALFHTTVKPHLGCEDVATRGCASGMSHGHWGDGAYLVLSRAPPGVSAHVQSLGDQQRQLQQRFDHPEKRRILQQLTSSSAKVTLCQ